MSDYNGWTNWETWNLNLWAENDEPTYRHVIAERPYTPAKAARVAFGLFPEGTPDMDGPEELDAVDWAEIAKAWNDILEDDMPADDGGDE